MKLYMKQKVFSWTEKFTVKDESGNDKYYVAGQFFSWGKKLHVTDLNGKEVAFISQKVFSFLPRYFVLIDGEQVAEIVKEFTFFVPKYSVRGLGWTIEGNLMAHDYTINKDGAPIVTIHKEWISWGDSYSLDIANPSDEIVALGVVLAIDCVLAQQHASSTSSGYQHH